MGACGLFVGLCMCGVEGTWSLWCFFWGCSSIEDVEECNGVSFGFSRGCSNRVFLMVFCLWLRVSTLGVLWCVLVVWG